MALSPKHQRFVAEYLIDLNATQAAVRAGYTPKAARVTGPRLLSDVAVAAAIAQGQAKALNQAELSASRTLEEIRRVGFSDLRGFFDASGNLKPMHELTAEQGACLSSVEVVKKNLAAGDGHVDQVHKLKTWDKPRALEMLAKHFGLLVDRLEHSGEVTIKHELPA